MYVYIEYVYSYVYMYKYTNRTEPRAVSGSRIIGEMVTSVCMTPHLSSVPQCAAGGKTVLYLRALRSLAISGPTASLQLA